MFSDVITKKRRRGKRNKNKVKELAVKIIFFIFSSRNNFFINGVDFLGNSVFRTTGGKICYIRGQSRRTKKSKGTLSLMSLHLKAFLLSRRFTHIAFVFRIRFSLSRFFFFKINRTLKKKKKSQLLKPKCVFLKRVNKYAHGGCRPGKRRNFKSKRKKKNWYRGRWGRFCKLKAKKLKFFM